MITELSMVKRYDVTMTRAQVCEAVHIEPRTLIQWVQQGRFPKPLHSNRGDGQIWATQAVARYIDNAQAALDAAAA